MRSPSTENPKQTNSEVVVMARARSPDSIEAEKMYRSGMKLVDIAKKLGKPDSTVRRWKSDQKWEVPEKKKSERSEKKKASVRKPGAPQGNKNAEGAGAPERNKNAEKHGAYSSVYWDFLEPDEQEMIEVVPTDEERLLIEQIQLFAVRERRIMKAINKYSAVKGGMYVAGVSRFESKRSFKNEEEENQYNEIVKEKIKAKEKMPGQGYQLTTNTNATIELVSRLEKELTSVQSKKTKAIDSLIRLRLENRKLDDAGKGSELVDDWIASIMGDLPEPEEGDGE